MYGYALQLGFIIGAGRRGVELTLQLPRSHDGVTYGVTL